MDLSHLSRDGAAAKVGTRFFLDAQIQIMPGKLKWIR